MIIGHYLLLLGFSALYFTLNIFPLFVCLRSISWEDIRNESVDELLFESLLYICILAPIIGTLIASAICEVYRKWMRIVAVLATYALIIGAILVVCGI